MGVKKRSEKMSVVVGFTSTLALLPKYFGTGLHRSGIKDDPQGATIQDTKFPGIINS
jgi:hypothetical protein